MNPTVRQMRNEPRPEAESSLLTRAVEAYRDLEQAGHKPDRAAFVACYPEIAEALSDCLAGLEWIEAFASVRVVSDLEEAPAETMAALVSSLSDFRILREVGRGGMGIVYEAEQLSLGRRVALKILPMAAALDARRLQRFRNEAHAAAQLQHPHIVPVFAIGQEHGIHYYAMQFIDGSTLSQIIKRFQADTATTAGDARPVAESAEGESATIPFLPGPAKLLDSPVGSPAFFNAAAELGFQAAEALEHAHQLGIVHRDIKPANLMLDEEGHLWVTDFGLARHLGEADNLTKSGDLLGTIRYMSPEQAQARHGLVDQRTDIYALGITLYELVTLQAAFRADEREELLRQVCWEEPRAPRRIDHRVPADLETIILKAASKEPQSRYATAREMADDLKRFLHGEPIHARPTRTSERILNWCRRRPALVRSAALISVLMIIVLSVSMALIWRAEQKGEAKLGHASKRLALARQTFDEIEAYRDLWFMPMPNAQNVDDRFLAKAEAFYEQIARTIQPRRFPIG